TTPSYARPPATSSFGPPSACRSSRSSRPPRSGPTTGACTTGARTVTICIRSTATSGLTTEGGTRMSELPASAKQKTWYDPTYCGGMSPEEVEVFLGSPDSSWLCRLAVLKEDGWPFVTPMWYQWRDGSFWVVGRKRSAWVQDLIRDPRAFVCIDEAAMPPEGG